MDLLIAIMPKIEPYAPTVGPALLKSLVESKGYTCQVVDFNLEMYRHLESINRAQDLYFKDDRIFTNTIVSSDEVQKFYIENKVLFDSWLDKIARLQPKILGLSLLSRYSGMAASLLSQLVRQAQPQMKIIWGGPMVSHYAEYVLDHGYIDHFIQGDGEEALLELLSGNSSHQGIDNIGKFQNVEMSNHLIPNYEDIHWDQYPRESFKNLVYLTGSRGCVRRCSFCNVAQIWPKFRFRDAQSLAQEIRELHEKYNRTTFHFTDSLINGSRRTYRELLQELKQIKKDIPDFQWISQWIIRPQSQAPESEFADLHESGCSRLEIGLESFNEEVRLHMGKRFSNEDVDWCLSMLAKHHVPASYLMFVGYPTETEAIHQERLDKLSQLSQNGLLHAMDAYDTPLLNFSFTSTMMLGKDMPLWEKIKDRVTNFKSEFEWDYLDNNFETRVRWLNETNQHLKELKKGDSFSWMIERSQNEINKKLSGSH